jgi:hypothetical protein
MRFNRTISKDILDIRVYICTWAQIYNSCRQLKK